MLKRSAFLLSASWVVTSALAAAQTPPAAPAKPPGPRRETTRGCARSGEASGREASGREASGREAPAKPPAASLRPRRLRPRTNRRPATTSPRPRPRAKTFRRRPRPARVRADPRSRPRPRQRRARASARCRCGRSPPPTPPRSRSRARIQPRRRSAPRAATKSTPRTGGPTPGRCSRSTATIGCARSCSTTSRLAASTAPTRHSGRCRATTTTTPAPELVRPSAVHRRRVRRVRFGQRQPEGRPLSVQEQDAGGRQHALSPEPRAARLGQPARDVADQSARQPGAGLDARGLLELAERRRRLPRHQAQRLQPHRSLRQHAVAAERRPQQLPGQHPRQARLGRVRDPGRPAPLWAHAQPLGPRHLGQRGRRPRRRLPVDERPHHVRDGAQVPGLCTWAAPGTSPTKGPPATR